MIYANNRYNKIGGVKLFINEAVCSKKFVLKESFVMAPHKIIFFTFSGKSLAIFVAIIVPNETPTNKDELIFK
jgi:hypothetical protein